MKSKHRDHNFMITFRWIYHHYCAMLMALISLTWEIKGQPDCASKQVAFSFLSFDFSFILIHSSYRDTFLIWK